MTHLFVDTSAWCAFFNTKDRHHAEARAHWQRIIQEKIALFTSEYVLDETITLLRKRVGFAQSKEAGEHLLASKILHRLPVDRREFLLAWEWYKKYHDHDLSFTDCTSFVLMKAQKIDQAWAFDDHFANVGFAVLR